MNAGEEDAVDALLRAAFDTHAEAQLVRKLRKARVIAGEMVMPMGGDVVGYYALSKMIKPKGWLALAPVAIHPEHQGKSYGKRMMGMLSEWARLTNTPVVVLGAAGFYGKAGFSSAAAQGLVSEYPADDLLLAGVTGSPSETLVYPAAFEGV